MFNEYISRGVQKGDNNQNDVLDFGQLKYLIKMNMVGL